MTRTNWNDAGSLRETLAGMYATGFCASRIGFEHEVVRTLSSLTGLSRDEIRANAHADAIAQG